MKPRDFWITQVVYIAFFVAIIFFSHHGALPLFATLAFVFINSANRSIGRPETRRQKLTGTAIVCGLFAIAIPSTWGRPLGLVIIAAFLINLVFLIVWSRQKVDVQTPLRN
jgi:hypothetical protein